MREAGASIRQQKGEGWCVLRVGKYQSQPQLKFLLYQLIGISNKSDCCNEKQPKQALFYSEPNFLVNGHI